MLIPLPSKSHQRRLRVKAGAATPTPPPPPPPTSVSVVNVVWIDEQHAQWNFSLPVLSVEDATGLFVAGQAPDSFDLNADGVLVTYSSGVSVDDPWSITPGEGSVAITFGDGGGILVVPESGNVV